jgi:hypothetical protein
MWTPVTPRNAGQDFKMARRPRRCSTRGCDASWINLHKQLATLTFTNMLRKQKISLNLTCAYLQFWLDYSKARFAGIDQILPHSGETAYKWAGRFCSASLVLEQNKRGLSSCPPECCRFCNCANVHMRQANVPSISPLSATTRPLRMYSPVRFWLCLLAYLLVSSVAIALASPSWAERPRSFDLNSYPDQGELTSPLN